MQKLKTILKKNLKGAKRIALLGIGSELRRDDAAGFFVASGLSRFKPSKNVRFKSFFGSTAPENLTGEIRRFKPTHLIIVDSVDMGKKSGAVIMIGPEMIKGASFGTHRLPLNILSDYFVKNIGCDIMILGIQHKDASFGQGLSKEVENSVKKLSKLLAGSIRAA